MVLINPSILRFVFPWILWKGPSDRREIILTFDDGPHPVYTPESLDILAGFQAKAVFFLNGQNVLLYPGVVEKLRIGDHVLGIHGFSHPRMDFRKSDFVLQEVDSAIQAVQKITGERSKYFRPPYGRFDMRFRKILGERNMKMVMWSLLTCDFRETDPEILIRTVRNRLHNGAVLVFHDGHRNAPVMLKALPEILNLIRQMDYQIRTLDDWI